MDGGEPPPLQPLRRRNSISTSVVMPTTLTVPSNGLPSSHANGTVCSSPPPSTSPLDFELLSLKSSSLSYTSLKDIIPSTAVNSPTAASVNSPIPPWSSAYEISIRNRLVKHAAWAYLQPMSSSPDSSDQHFLRRFWVRFWTENPVSGCFRFLSLHVFPSITGALDRFIRAIRIWTHR